MNLLLRWFASRNSASPNPLVDADANETTSLNSLLCSLVPRNLASLNLLADAGTGAFEGISHSLKTERNESAVYRQLAIAASAFRIV
ncbi:hypothetical protein GHH_c05050 [Geobacillus sp. GHH01]|nr:hypothetical protein GHH_c05050 [Geobacillus sp. GHH01]